MKITPIDIQKQQFRLRFRGFDVREVDAFLEDVAGEFKELVSENESLKGEVARLEAQLADYRSREKTLQETLVGAQQMGEAFKEQARRQGELVVSEAELKAERILHEAQQRLTRLHDDLTELRRQYIQFEASIRAAVEAHLRLLEATRQGHSGLPEDARPGSDRPQA